MSNNNNNNNNGDDDDDPDNDREYNGTLKYSWDYARDQSKFALLSLKRDNYAPGCTRFSARLAGNGPTLNAVTLSVDRMRHADDTHVNASLGYELKNGKSNRLDVQATMSSTHEVNSLAIEQNLARPAFNIHYATRFNKKTGRLAYTGLRVAQLLKFAIDKEHDDQQRRIGMELVNPDASVYSLECVRQLNSAGVNLIESKLSDATSGALISRLTSSFDSNANSFKVLLDAVKTGQKFAFTFGVFNETLASAAIRNENDLLALASVQVLSDTASGERVLVLNAKWSRVWAQIKRAILGQSNVAVAEKSDKFNSFFGDVYGELAAELKPTYDNWLAERSGVREDVQKLVYVLADFYLSAVPKYKEELRKRALASAKSDAEFDALPLHVRLFRRYQSLSEMLEHVRSKLKARGFRITAGLVPRLPLVAYNTDSLSSAFANNVEVRRPMKLAHNLYQFYAEQREFMKNLAGSVIDAKSAALRNTDGLSLKALINKYKYRPLDEYTMVATVYNKRHVLAFNGEARVMRAKCRTLLLNELRRNKFSVVLNAADAPAALTVVAGDNQVVDVTYDRAFVNGKQVALPLRGTKGLSVVRTANAVCLRVGKDLKVCCYEDSKSCVVALTRFFSGRVDGLLGSSALSSPKNFVEEYWSLDKSCSAAYPASAVALKRPSDAAVATCHGVFGNKRKSFFRNSFTVVRPAGWQQVCEHVMTNDAKSKCALLKAFVHHAKVKNAEVDEPNECCECNLILF